MPITEADTCRMYVLPLLHEAGFEYVTDMDRAKIFRKRK